MKCIANSTLPSGQQLSLSHWQLVHSLGTVTHPFGLHCIHDERTWLSAISGYFDAPATREAPLGGAGSQGLKEELPLVTLVFSAVDGLKAMRVRKVLALLLCCCTLCCTVLCWHFTQYCSSDISAWFVSTVRWQQLCCPSIAGHCLSSSSSQ